MICISIAQRSHGLAFADMVNAGHRCDLIEIRLDRLDKEPDVPALLEACPKPAIVACRRPQDGGDWSGSESDRLRLLQKAVQSGAAWVEIELDCDEAVPRQGSTRRIISYTNCAGVPDNLGDIHRAACAKDADVVKLTLPTPSPEAAWPMIKVAAQGPVPTVLVGLGTGGWMLNILGQRHGAPWIYTALERGYEPYQGLSNIFDLEDIYDIHSIDRTTRLVAIAGFSEQQRLTARALNHGFRLTREAVRCVPLEIGDIDVFARVARATKLSGLVVDDGHRESIVRLATKLTEPARQAKAADTLTMAEGGWLGFSILSHAVTQAMEETLRSRGNGTLDGMGFLIVGCSGTARTTAVGLRSRGASVMFTDEDEYRCGKVAYELGGLCVPPSEAAMTDCDGLVLCPSDVHPRPGIPAVRIDEAPVNNEDVLVVDLTRFPFRTPFLQRAAEDGAHVVDPMSIFTRMLQSVINVFCGRFLSDEEVREAIDRIENT